MIIPLPVTNWASDKGKFIPNYSVEIIIFFILWSAEIIIFFILWSQHPYYDLNIKFLQIMISTANFSKLWSQQCVCLYKYNFFKTKTKAYYFSHLHSLEFHLFFALIVPFKNIRMVKNSTALALLPLWSLLRRKKSGGDPGISGLQRVDQQGPSSPSFKVRDMLLFKLSVRHPYWPVQVS